MLWIALHFPALSLEIFSRGAAASGPLAVFEKQGNRPVVIACNAAAADRGVQAGMALGDGLVARARDLVAEQESLSGIATWAGQFTPSVSVQPPDGLLLEVATCLRLHHGLDKLLRMMRGGLEEMGYSFTMACAPTPHGAWLLARSGALNGAGAEVVIREPAELEKSLGRLPVRLLEQPPEVWSGLEMIGVHTVRDCLRLPRAGMARRFGQALLDELDRARGALPEAREFFVPPAEFERRMELPATVYEAEALQFAARRLLPELEGYLSLRRAGVQECELVCSHEAVRTGAVPPTVIKLGFAKPTRDLARMQLLLRETLARTRLAAPVYAIALHAGLILPLDDANGDMFQEGEKAEEGSLLLERLRIRLGEQAVFGIAPHAEHRPERAWRRCDAGEADAGKAGAPAAGLPRPLWLLPRPVPCREGRLVLKSGPERIESGWWDGRDAVRDYYVAQDGQGARLWVYCDRIDGEWFIHGLFA